uniref:Uncharacterized protein n=1 Tax=Sphaerodactylus townsendi TaxID=933632 RepID=A0ACB8FGY8_9SAUR
MQPEGQPHLNGTHVKPKAKDSEALTGADQACLPAVGSRKDDRDSAEEARVPHHCEGRSCEEADVREQAAAAPKQKDQPKAHGWHGQRAVGGDSCVPLGDGR